jgi:mono/diheme cytochrome c family protein
MKMLLPLLLMLVSCTPMFSGKSPLVFRELKDQNKNPQTIELERTIFLQKKAETWELIVQEAKQSFAEIEPIIQKKCQDCHNSKIDVPRYGRIFRRINPVNLHHVNGVKAVDFVDIFPLKAEGKPVQLSLLKAVRESIVSRTMPLKAYTLVYPKKKINATDEELLLAWIDPLIEKVEDYELRYNQVDGVSAEAHKILEQKCFRCHAHGVAKGQFGDMENAQKMLKGGFIRPHDPESSSLYKIMANQKMPPNKKEALTEDELRIVRDWFESLENN